ncbi:hypothetical protein B0A69_09535 [Chryseobacterium shigense]|uniref:TIGR04222 domain-containing protein n=1 Tax=Chryseobacterium shigense TaxID=297244 RepID=A0A1N7IGS1_9FLAO|nr:hypothetical protein [Chryseobacterium shigense]PQA94685.1 hypothetical protein B0A69_09535 [Chryseobacterium shigense]SIS36151.1 hypothetical protein SAMN05421639_103697 [Chryseobacterium shigense]
METTILLKDETLWNRIQSFSLDASDADFPFSKKLAKEERWTLDFAQKAIQEYKKFVYLCCILPNGASPSETVDKVWHMHLIYTQNYWEEFCPKVLKRSLHHHPSKGGSKEKNKHQSWFSDTLKNYHNVFRHEAPEEIWHPKQKKGIMTIWLKRRRVIPLLIVPFMLSSCLGEVLGSLTLLALPIIGFLIFFHVVGAFQGDIENNTSKKKDDGSIGGSSDGGSSGCSSGCGGGCGGCGGGCGG